MPFLSNLIVSIGFPVYLPVIMPYANIREQTLMIVGLDLFQKEDPLHQLPYYFIPAAPYEIIIPLLFHYRQNLVQCIEILFDIINLTDNSPKSAKWIWQLRSKFLNYGKRKDFTMFWHPKWADLLVKQAINWLLVEKTAEASTSVKLFFSAKYLRNHQILSYLSNLGDNGSQEFKSSSVYLVVMVKIIKKYFFLGIPKNKHEVAYVHPLWVLHIIP